MYIVLSSDGQTTLTALCLTLGRVGIRITRTLFCVLKRTTEWRHILSVIGTESTAQLPVCLVLDRCESEVDGWIEIDSQFIDGPQQKSVSLHGFAWCRIMLLQSLWARTMSLGTLLLIAIGKFLVNNPCT